MPRPFASRFACVCGSVAALFVTGALAFAGPPANIPRKSPPLTFTQPQGSEASLSAFKGKVIVVEFLFVRSPHCLQLAEMLNHLHRDLGARGLEPIAVAFGPNSDPSVLLHMVDYFKLTYPVGYTASDKVDAYLGRQGNEILKIPQIVVIDRKGLIRAASGAKGDPKLENETELRALLDSLLSEPSPTRKRAN